MIRLGHEDGWHQLPSCGGTVASEMPVAQRRGEDLDGAANCRRRLIAQPTMAGCSKQVAGFYHETLKQSPEALEYL